MENINRNSNAGLEERLGSFKPVEFDGFKKQAGLNSFVLMAKQWIEKTNAIQVGNVDYVYLLYKELQ